MPRVLIEYELQSVGTFVTPDDLEFSHPRSDLKITLREKDVSLEGEFATLSAFVVLEANSMEEGVDEALPALSEFVHALKLTTSLDLQIHRRVRAVDWTIGVENRTLWEYKSFVGDDRPYKLLTPGLVQTAELLTSEFLPPILRRAIRWFSLAVSARYMDEQFQCFWFSLELLAQHVKPTGKVPDACAMCRQPLYCANCRDHPRHRPYPKQSIQYIFGKVITDKPEEAFDLTNEIRNRLMHGESIEDIEESLGLEFHEIVDRIGQTAWRALVSVIRITLESQGIDAQVEFLQCSTFSHITGIVRANMIYTSPNPECPIFGEWPETNLEVVRRENPYKPAG